MTSVLIKDIYSTSIWFILHSLTITTALTWNEVITKLINTYNSNLVKHHLIYAMVLTLFSVLLHITFGKYSHKPSDTELEDADNADETNKLTNNNNK